jgi:hypothetical protein
VPGLLVIGHGLQKLVPAKYSPTLLHANGPSAAAGFFEQLGLRPAVLRGCPLAGRADLRREAAGALRAARP